ncbi:MAG: sigma-54-dependent Fis family transcriptional regulator [Desulfarculaceae bacterium]|jgi:transcriptional regulator with GAF, ATPase, and Fis domain
MKAHKPLAFYKALFEDLNPKEFQARFLKTLMELQNVERGSLWVKRGSRYVCTEAAGSHAQDIKGLSISAGRPSIAGWVIENGEMAIAEAGKDSRHFKEIEDGFSEKSSLILCFPLTLKDGTVYGAVEIIDTSADGQKLNLNKDYLELLQNLVSIGSIALSNSLEYADRVAENKKLKDLIKETGSPRPLIGQSEAFLNVLKTMETYAATDFPVLITGESGTGKELVSAEIHRLSARKRKPFLVQNCSAIPDTLLESELFGYKKGAFTGADQDKAGLFAAVRGGTVFLDEIGDMPQRLQARILRVVQSNEVKPLGATKAVEVNARIISATNKDLKQAISAGEFREDLYYRLNVLPLEIPPLRERRDDIPLLLTHFLNRYSASLDRPPKKFGPKALATLADYPWPGNVRELENLVRYAMTTTPGDVIEETDLPSQYTTAPPGPAATRPAPVASQAASQTAPPTRPGPPDLTAYTWEDMERTYVLSLLERYKWNVTRAASEADLKRTTFTSRMKKLGISKN